MPGCRADLLTERFPWRRPETGKGRSRSLHDYKLLSGEGLAKIWADKPGGCTHEIQMQCTTALLRWAREEQRLGEEWEPPQNLATYVGRSRTTKAITTPLEVEDIPALVDALLDAR